MFFIPNFATYIADFAICISNLAMCIANSATEIRYKDNTFFLKNQNYNEQSNKNVYLCTIKSVTS